jgi:hypothetical protein
MPRRAQGRTRGLPTRLSSTAGIVAFATFTAVTSAEPIYISVREGGGLNEKNLLMRFDSATPGVVTNLGEITNLGPLQYLEDIDFRPATGELYGLGYTGSVYKIDVNTLVANSVGFNGAPMGSSGFVGAGIDFNPVTDRLRIIDGATGANYSFQIGVPPGTLNTTVSYVANNPDPGNDPHVGGVAYSNNVNGALTTTLYSIDINPATAFLGSITPPASGNITGIGSLGAAVFKDDVGGFDISGTSGVAYAIMNDLVPMTGFVPNLYTIDLTTGAATLVGAVGITSAQRVSGLSVAPEPGGPGNNIPLPAALLAAPAGAALALRHSRRLRPTHR